MADDWPDYELIDFGAGRKLERFGAWNLLTEVVARSNAILK